MPSQLFPNCSATAFRYAGNPVDPQILLFHQKLPGYAITPLIPLPTVAKELGLRKVFLKDESQRFGLPSFKVLGASWSIHCALAEKCGLEQSATLEEVGRAARARACQLVTCTEGNWGRAVSRMARYLGIRATIFTPHSMDDATSDKIAGEGAIVKQIEGDYDDAIAEAVKASKEHDMLLVMDTSWPGFEQSSRWVVDGYSTMLAEVDDQLTDQGSEPVTLAIASVGVGSWAQAVTQHYKCKEPTGMIATVEPETAACFKTSLESGQNVPVKTGDTMMSGMNCGTVSSIAWPILRAGVDVALTVSDWEAHQAVLYLRECGVDAGPCGAATLAALKKLHRTGLLKLDAESSVILFSTEGSREYAIPQEKND